MATPQTYQSYVLSPNTVETSKTITGVNKLFAAAVVNNQFCQLLLNEPTIALQQGYFGDAFDLTLEEQALIISIRAKSLPELAQQVTKALDRSIDQKAPDRSMLAQYRVTRWRGGAVLRGMRRAPRPRLRDD